MSKNEQSVKIIALIPFDKQKTGISISINALKTII